MSTNRYRFDSPPLRRNRFYFLSRIARLIGQKTFIYLFLGLMGTGIALNGCSRFSQPQVESSASPAQNQNQNRDRPLTPIPADNNFVVEVVKRVEPSVVQINISKTVRTQTPEAFNDPIFRRFFGEAVPMPPPERTEEGIGSGFVINPNGQILTNAHVVSDADTVTVTFPDGRTLEGKVLGSDPATDIAVVQVPAQNLPSVTLGRSEQVQPGQWAIAIGNPLGLQETVTVGVISATNRSGRDIGVSDKRIGFIQTDAAINPGNSGGPLLNARGEVVGINTAIIGGAQGLGFAIPIDDAQRIAQELIRNGKVEHPYLGIRMATLTPEVKKELARNPNLNFKVSADRGVLIVQVVPNSPAAAAGLRPGDVIQTINNQPVTEAEELQQLVEQSGIGSQLPITVERQGRRMNLTVRPAPLPAQTN